MIYLISNDGKDGNIYDEYIWIEEDSKFELIGTVGVESINDEIVESEYEKYIKPYLNKTVTVKMG